jgi:hypothetical protein
MAKRVREELRDRIRGGMLAYYQAGGNGGDNMTDIRIRLNVEAMVSSDEFVRIADLPAHDIEDLINLQEGSDLDIANKRYQESVESFSLEVRN